MHTNKIHRILTTNVQPATAAKVRLRLSPAAKRLAKRLGVKEKVKFKTAPKVTQAAKIPIPEPCRDPIVYNLILYCVPLDRIRH